MLDTARFAPERREPPGVARRRRPRPGACKAALRDLICPGWYEYLAKSAAGLVPWAPITDRDAESRALEAVRRRGRRGRGGPGRVRRAPRRGPRPRAGPRRPAPLATVDRDLDRYTFVGGASVYPFVWSILLAARAEGLAGVMTTMVVRREAEVRAAFGVPDHMAVAAVVALGRPVRQPTRLTRQRVEDFATVDRFDGPAFRGPG